MPTERNPTTWTLRLRFRVAPDRVIMDEAVSQRVGSLDYSLRKEPVPSESHEWFYATKIEGFTSEAGARGYVENMRVGFAWLLLEHDVAAEVAFDIQEMARNRDTNGLPIAIDGARAAVYPTHMRLSVVTGFAPLIRQGLPARIALSALTEGVQFRRFYRLATENRLVVALDLYRAHFTEPSATVRFLTLIMALEALAPQVIEPDLLRTLIEKWRLELGTHQEALDEKSDDARSLKSLDTTLKHRRDGSSRGRVRHLVHSTLTTAGASDAAGSAARALQLYDLRSELMHNGRLKDPEKLGPAFVDAKEIVVRILKARFQEVVK